MDKSQTFLTICQVKKPIQTPLLFLGKKIDLALEKRRRDESVTRYISRWRNMSMKCEQQLDEEHAIQLIMGNIDDKMVPYLCMASISTFQELIDRSIYLLSIVIVLFSVLARLFRLAEPFPLSQKGLVQTSKEVIY